MLRITKYIREGAEIYRKYPYEFIIGGFLIGLLNVLFFGTLTGIHFYGMTYMTLKALRGERPEIADAFKGFEKARETIPVGLAVLSGLLACGVGIFVTGALFMYAFPLLAERNIRAGEALRVSLEVSRQDLLGHILLFFLVTFLGLMGGVLFLGVFLTLPLTFTPLVVAYVDRTAQSASSSPTAHAA